MRGLFHKKLLLVLVLLMFIGVLSNGVLADKSTCNKAGGIYCDEGCVHQGSSQIGVCTVSSDQTVLFGSAEEQTFEFKTLNLGSKGNPVKLWFLIKSPPDSCHAWGGSSCDGYINWNKCSYGASEGGYGAGGQDRTSSGKAYGGSGGAGGSGGLQFKPGSVGSQGSAGGRNDTDRCNDGSSCDSAFGSICPGSGGRPGANVKLIISTLNQYGSTISVNGEDGGNGDDGSAREIKRNGNKKSAGIGAGGAGGGGGAGKLTLIANSVNEPGTFSADGGTGGTGGDCGSAAGGANGGAGGGAGGGQNGQIFVSSNLDLSSYFHTEPGSHGSHGSFCSGMKAIAGDGNGHDGNSLQVSQGVISEKSDECSNTVDDEGDSFTDFEDRDCYITAAVTDNDWDNDGPIQFSSYADQLGLKGPLDYFPDWNPSAIDGSDGVCGDDEVSKCVFVSSESCSSFSSEETCLSELNCSWTDLGDSNCLTIKSCQDYAASSCPSPCMVINGVCGRGNSDCSNYKNSMEKCKEASNCKWSPANEKCKGDISCRGFTSLSSCSDYSNHGCEWRNSDLGYTAMTLFNNGQSSFARYWCNKDSKTLPSSQNDATFTHPSSSSSNWRWWDAQDLGVPFKTHILDTGNSYVDFISNSKEWYYCNATGASGNVLKDNSAIPISEMGSFKRASNSGDFSCSDFMSLLSSTLFSDGGDCAGLLTNGGTLFSDNLTCQGTDCSNYTCGYVNNPGNPSAFSLSTSDVGDSCFKDCAVPDGDYSQTFDNFINNLPSSNECKIAINKFICEHNPTDDSCQSGFEGLDENDNGLFEKASCGFNLGGCFEETPNYLNACNDIDMTVNEVRYRGHACTEPKEYCALGTSTLSNDSSSISSCCLVEDADYDSENICEVRNDDFSSSDCEAIGGSWLADNNDYTDYVCSPSSDMMVGPSCCLGSWEPNFARLALSSLTQPDAFTCYSHAGDARISECCTDYTVCNQHSENSLFSDSSNVDGNFGFYGKGGVTHSLKNFDKFTGDSLNLVDFIKVKSFTPSSYEQSIDFRSTIYPKNRNISTFDQLEFDIAYNVENLQNTLSINLTFDDGSSCNLGDLSQYLINGFSEMRWHHVVIPLDNCPDNRNGSLSKIIFKTPNLVSKIALDNFFLSENKTNRNDFENTPNQYCTGNFGDWITDLDGPNSSYFFNLPISDVQLNDHESDGVNIFGTGRYWYACESQASFDWTGRACCGDDTRKAFEGDNNNHGEYFADTKAGCFHGVTVYNDMTVKEALNNENYRDILFYNGTFIGCTGNNNSDHHGKKISYDGETLGGSLVTHFVEPLTTKGSHICLESGDWMKTSDYPAARLIASTLYNFTLEKDGSSITQLPYELTCDNLEDIMPYTDDKELENLKLKQSSETSNAFLSDVDVTNFCTVQFKDPHNKLKRIIGFQYNDSDGDVTVGSVLNSLQPHLIASSSDLAHLDVDSFVKSCDGANIDGPFYQLCDFSDGHLRLAYSPSFNIIIIATDVKDPVRDYHKFFDSGSTWTYVQHVWQSFVNLFNGWFAKDVTDQHSDLGVPRYDAQTRIAFLTENASVHQNEQDAEFSKLYMKNTGHKEILALAEHPRTEPNSLYYTIQYQGFTADVSYLANTYLGTGIQNNYVQNYIYGNGNMQIISLGEDSSNKLRGVNRKGQEKTFEPPFDWKRLTFKLSINDSVPGSNGYLRRPNDCKIELGEECDTCVNGSIIYKFGADTCAKWYNVADEDVTGQISCSSSKVTGCSLVSN